MKLSRPLKKLNGYHERALGHDELRLLLKVSGIRSQLLLSLIKRKGRTFSAELKVSSPLRKLGDLELFVAYALVPKTRLSTLLCKTLK